MEMHPIHKTCEACGLRSDKLVRVIADQIDPYERTHENELHLDVCVECSESDEVIMMSVTGLSMMETFILELL